MTKQKLTKAQKSALELLATKHASRGWQQPVSRRWIVRMEDNTYQYIPSRVMDSLKEQSLVSITLKMRDWYYAHITPEGKAALNS